MPARLRLHVAMFEASHLQFWASYLQLQQHLSRQAVRKSYCLLLGKGRASLACAAMSTAGGQCAAIAYGSAANLLAKRLSFQHAD